MHKYFDNQNYELSYKIAKENDRKVIGACPEIYKDDLKKLNCDLIFCFYLLKNFMIKLPTSRVQAHLASKIYKITKQYLIRLDVVLILQISKFSLLWFDSKLPKNL